MAHQDAANEPDQGKNAQNAHLLHAVPIVPLADIPAEELPGDEWPGEPTAEDVVLAHDPAARHPWIIVVKTTGRRLGAFLTRAAAEQNARTLRAEWG